MFMIGLSSKGKWVTGITKNLIEKGILPKPFKNTVPRPLDETVVEKPASTENGKPTESSGEYRFPVVTQVEKAYPYSGPSVEGEFLNYVVSDTKFNPDNIVAVGVTTNHFWYKNKLLALYLTKRGQKESRLSELAIPYAAFEQSITPEGSKIEPLDEKLEDVITFLENADTLTKHLIDIGGPDEKKRVVAIYSAKNHDTYPR